MENASITFAAFVDELEKISAAHGRMHVPKSRAGRRPISAARLLAKEKDGTLFKNADAAGNPQNVSVGWEDPGAAKPPKRLGDVPTREGNKTATVRGEVTPFPMGESPYAFQEAKKPRKKGDVPSRDDSNVVDRFDGRDNATTVHGVGHHATGIGAMNHPAEHT